MVTRQQIIKYAPNVPNEILKEVKPVTTSPKNLKPGDYVWVFQDGRPKTQFAVQVLETWEDEGPIHAREYHGFDYKWLKILGGDGEKHYATKWKGTNKWENGEIGP